jgi:hypothetical protein
MGNKALDITALTVVIIGAVNWGLLGFFNFNLVGLLTGGGTSFIARVIYALVGVAGVYMLTMYSRLGDRSY